MLDLINAAQAVVLDVLKFVDKIIQDLLSLAYDAIAGFQDMLTKNIDIPVISWIWKQISGHSLTMLDLFSLGVAVPTTLLYKLTFGLPGATAPFTDDEAQQIVETLNNPQTFPWPILGSGLAAASSGFTPEAASSPFTPEVISSLQKALAVPGALVFTVADWFSDYVGWANYNFAGIYAQTARYAGGFKSLQGCFFVLLSPQTRSSKEFRSPPKWTSGVWAIGRRVSCPLSARWS